MKYLYVYENSIFPIIHMCYRKGTRCSVDSSEQIVMFRSGCKNNDGGKSNEREKSIYDCYSGCFAAVR